MQDAPSSDHLAERAKLVASVRERHIDASKIRDTRAAISDLGESGMFMEMSDPPPKGTILEVEFDLPGGAARKKVLGIVRWREKAGPRAGVGVRFAPIGPGERSGIRQIIERRARELNGDAAGTGDAAQRGEGGSH